MKKNLWKSGQAYRKGCEVLARARMTGFEDLEKMFRILGAADEMAIKAVDDAVPILEKNLKAEIMSAAEHPTGELTSHIGTTKAKKNEYGVFAVVKPDEDYVDRLRWFDIGHHDINGDWHKGKGVRQRAVNASKDACRKIIEEHVERFADEAAR